MHGTGKFAYASGNVYDGTWSNGVYQGTGSYVWPDGRRYEVSWHSLNHPISQCYVLGATGGQQIVKPPVNSQTQLS